MAPAQCDQLAEYLTSTSDCKMSGLTFSCTEAVGTDTYDGYSVSHVQVCAEGGLEANSWVTGFSGICIGQLNEYFGYPLCDVFAIPSSTCGNEVVIFQQCQIPPIDFPHSCFPGNSANNGGYMTGVSTAGTPFGVDNLVLGNASFSFDIIGQECLEDIAPKGTSPNPVSCCKSSIEKIEVIMNPLCYGAIKNITLGEMKVPVSSSYSNNSYAVSPETPFPQAYPAASPWYQVFKVTKLTGPTTVTVNLRTVPMSAECLDPTFFLNGPQIWYAYFNGQDFGDNCCGTSILAA